MDYPIRDEAPNTADAVVPHALDGAGRAVPVGSDNPLPVGGAALEALQLAAEDGNPTEVEFASSTVFSKTTLQNVTTTTTLIVAANPDRVNLVLKVLSGGTECRISHVTPFVAADGFPLVPGADSPDLRGYKGPVYGRTASGSADVQVLEY